MKVIKKKVSNFIKMLSIKQLYFTAVLPLSIIGYILIAFSVRNVYFHQIKNTLTSETQNAIMNTILTGILIPFIMQLIPSFILMPHSNFFERTLCPHRQMINCS